MATQDEPALLGVAEAMEIALFGTALEASATLEERVTRINQISSPGTGDSLSVTEKLDQIFTACAMPAIVDLPPVPPSTAPRYATFVPMACVGVYTRKEDALAGLKPWLQWINSGGHDLPHRPSLGPQGYTARAFPRPGGPTSHIPPLNYIEFSLIAVFVPHHDRPISSSGQQPTSPEVYIAEKPTSVPRVRTPKIFAALIPNDDDQVKRVIISA